MYSRLVRMYENKRGLTLHYMRIIFPSYFPYFILWCFAIKYNTTIQKFDFWSPNVYNTGIINYRRKLITHY